MSLFSCAPPSRIAVSSLISHSRHRPGFATAALQFNGGSNNTRNCDLKCPCGHSRQQKAVIMTPRMSSLRPCCLVPQTGRQWPWRISASLSAVSKKEPPEKGWSAQALSFDLQVFTCHGYIRRRVAADIKGNGYRGARGKGCSVRTAGVCLSAGGTVPRAS